METGRAGGMGTSSFVLSAVVASAVLFLPTTVVEGGFRGGLSLDAAEVATLLAFWLLALGFWAFRRRFWPDSRRDCRSLRNALLIIGLQAIVLRGVAELSIFAQQEAWTIPTHVWLWNPWFLTSGLAVILLGGRLGVLVSLAGVTLLLLRFEPDSLPLTGCLVSSLFAVFMLRRCPTRSRVLRASFVSGTVLGVVAMADGYLKGMAFEDLGALGLIPMGVSLGFGFIVLALLPVVEWLLGELSDVTLVEYGSDHPLLDALKERAPGTWHHTLNVADLAEKAAVAIGARALFCRTASLYHDVGKLKNPGMFAENIDGESPHTTMEPEESARVIIDHVTHGLDLARKHGLPRAFRDVIAEHHGISVVRYFHAKACENLAEGEDADSIRPRFQYGGPPPSSRESGIIALADAVEAATRSLGPATEVELRRFVRKLIADRVMEGELAQCPLTLVELGRIEHAFIGWLKACHHQRPAYPKSVPEIVPATSSAKAVSVGRPLVSEVAKKRDGITPDPTPANAENALPQSNTARLKLATTSNGKRVVVPADSGEVRGQEGSGDWQAETDSKFGEKKSDHHGTVQGVGVR